MRFQVPQFIETETKIVGPFTLKQFAYIASGVVLIFLLNYLLGSFFYWILFSLPIAALALALAFAKIDGIPLPSYLVMAIGFGLGTKKYLYKKEGEDTEQYGK